MKFARCQGYLRSVPSCLGMMAFVSQVIGCATTPKPVPAAAPTSPAYVIVENGSDCAWKIMARPEDGSAPLESYVSARGSVELSLSPQTYRIEQSMLVRAEVVSSSRRFSFTPESGQRYRWHLGTLLSESLGKTDHNDQPLSSPDLGRGVGDGIDHE